MRKLLAITLCFTFVGMGSVLAQVELPKHTWELGTEISHITYKEPSVMEEKGMMYGIVGSYAYRGELFELQRCMLKVEGKFAYGQVDYKNSGTLDNIDDYILEFRGLGGYGFPVFTASTLTPYVGIGYRYLNDDMSGMTSSTGARGYERESNYLYSPIGVETITPLKNDWSVGAMLEYDIFWWGKQKSHLGSVPGYYDIENDQEKGYGIRGSIKVQKKLKKLDLLIEPYIRYWNIKDSKTTTDPAGTTWIEPKNNSTEIGCKLSVKF